MEPCPVRVDVESSVRPCACFRANFEPSACPGSPKSSRMPPCSAHAAASHRCRQPQCIVARCRVLRPTPGLSSLAFLTSVAVGRI